MKVKGTAVKSLQEYVEKHFPDGYSTWLDGLPEESKQIFKEAIIAKDQLKGVVSPTPLTENTNLSNEFDCTILLKREDLIMMRPGDGVSPMDIDLFINKQLSTNLPEGHKISKSDFIL